MTRRTRWKDRALALLVPPIVLIGCGAQIAAGVEATASSASPTSHGAPGWMHHRASLRTAPRRLLSRAHPGSPVRIITLRNVDGHPQVSVAVRHTRAGARVAVRQAQRAEGAIAVTVDARMQAQAQVSRSDDTDRAAQWALDRLDAEQVWTQQPGDGVVVAVVDTGVDAAHPDLSGVVLPGTDLVSPGGDGTADGNGHGTHVAGIIDAVANNNLGVAGLAQGVKILPVRVLDDSGSGWSSNIAQGIIWATDHGASVINLSLGGPGADDVMSAAVQYALDHGVVVVAAAGNDRANGDPTTYPAAYPGVIGVAASDSDDATASFSETGSFVDLAAPGVHIASTYPPSDYVYMSGTSMAAPFVSASAALLKAADPELDPAEATSTLESTATDLGPAGRDDDSGYGLVDPSAALCSLTGCPASSASPGSTPTSPTPTASPSSPGPTTTPVAPASTVTRLRAHSRRVRFGGQVRGRVVVRTDGHRLSGALVRLCVRSVAARTRCRRLTTDARGRAVYRLHIRRDVTVYAVHPADATTARSVSPAVDYQAVPRVRLHVRHGRLVVRVAPATAQVVHLERLRRHRWQRVQQAHLNRRGRVVFRHLPTGWFRIQVPRSPRLGGLTSRPRHV